VSALILTAACAGGSSSSPTGPSAPVDLTGAWDEGTGGNLTWQLSQNGATVSGSSAFSQENGPFLGGVSGQGVIAGTVSNGTFTFTDTVATLSKPNCSMMVSGQLTLSGARTMAGRYTEVDSCNGAVLGSTGGTITMRKR